MKTLIFLGLLLFGYSFGPSQSTVEPIRVRIHAEAGEDGGKFDHIVRAEVNKLKNAIVSERKRDYDLYFVATELTEGGRSYGFACSVLIVEEAKAVNRYKMAIYTGRSLELVTRHAVKETAEIIGNAGH